MLVGVGVVMASAGSSSEGVRVCVRAVIVTLANFVSVIAREIDKGEMYCAIQLMLSTLRIVCNQ